jgi:hypothetical protein
MGMRATSHHQQHHLRRLLFALLFRQCAAAAASALELAPAACTGASAGLDTADCKAWQDLYESRSLLFFWQDL